MHNEHSVSVASVDPKDIKISPVVTEVSKGEFWSWGICVSQKEGGVSQLKVFTPTRDFIEKYAHDLCDLLGIEHVKVKDGECVIAVSQETADFVAAKDEIEERGLTWTSDIWVNGLQRFSVTDNETFASQQYSLPGALKAFNASQSQAEE